MHPRCTVAPCVARNITGCGSIARRAPRRTSASAPSTSIFMTSGAATVPRQAGVRPRTRDLQRPPGRHMSHRRVQPWVERGLTFEVTQGARKNPNILVPVHLHMPSQQFDIARSRLKCEDLTALANQLGKQQRIKAHVRTHIPADHPRTDKLDDLPCFAASYEPNQQPCLNEPAIQRFPRRGPCKMRTSASLGMSRSGRRSIRPTSFDLEMPEKLITVGARPHISLAGEPRVVDGDPWVVSVLDITETCNFKFSTSNSRSVALPAFLVAGGPGSLAGEPLRADNGQGCWRFPAPES